MRISNKVLEQYQVLCPLSSMKCDTYEDIHYKIRRAVILGSPVLHRSDGSTVVKYYHLCFVVKNNQVLEMYKDLEKPWIEVDEYIKNEYDLVKVKVVV